MSLRESLRKAGKTAGLVIGLSGAVFSGSKLMAQEKVETDTASATITNIQTNILPFSVNSLSNNAVILSMLDKIAETPEGHAALRDSHGDFKVVVRDDMGTTLGGATVDEIDIINGAEAQKKFIFPKIDCLIRRHFI